MIKKIIVAVDFSDISVVVLDYAINLATAYRSEIFLLHVAEPLLPLSTGAEMEMIAPPLVNMAEDEDIMKGEMRAMEEHVMAKGIKVSSEVCMGLIVETILEKAKTYDADLIVAGAHNHGFLYNAFIGSVSGGIIKRSKCPVMIVAAKQSETGS